MNLTRREIIAAAAATAAIAAMPAVAIAGENEPVFLERLILHLHENGYAVLRAGDGGSILFWMKDRMDFGSVIVTNLGDYVSPSVRAALQRVKEIRPEMVF